jgi:hypothetical protein
MAPPSGSIEKHPEGKHQSTDVVGKKFQWCLGLMAVILATQDSVISKIAVRSQPGQIVHENLSWKKPITEKGWWSGSRCRPWVQTPVPYARTHTHKRGKTLSLATMVSSNHGDPNHHPSLARTLWSYRLPAKRLEKYTVLTADILASDFCRFPVHTWSQFPHIWLGKYLNIRKNQKSELLLVPSISDKGCSTCISLFISPKF